MLRLPSAVLLWLADALLSDADANALAVSCTAMLHAMQRYQWKSRVSLPHALHIQPLQSASVTAGPRLSFGVVRRVRIPPEWHAPLSQLPQLLLSLAPTVIDVEFADGWNASVELLQWPASLRSIDLGGRFDRAVSAWRLPAALTELHFGSAFDQPIDGLQLPATMLRVNFGSAFSSSLASLTLPLGLEELFLSWHWNRPLSDLPALPDSLLLLSFGNSFDQPLHTLQQPWPLQLRTLILGRAFSQPLLGVQLPDAITELHLDEHWNHSLDGVHLPNSLTALKIDGRDFKHSLHGVDWPAGLLSLSLPRDWNQPVAGLRLPPSLTRLHWGSNFYQPLRGWSPPALLTDVSPVYACGMAADLRLPQSLKRFTMPWGWKVELAALTLPDGLQSLKLDWETRIPEPARVRFPAALTSLSFGGCALPSLAGFVWPPGLTHLDTGSFNEPLLVWNPPASLTRLDLGGDAAGGWNLYVTQLRLPPHLVELRFGSAFNRCLRGLQVPPSLTSLMFDCSNSCCELFNQPLTEGALPSSLRRLQLPDGWKQPLHQLCLPRYLESLTFDGSVNAALEELQLPDSLRELQFRWLLATSLRALRLPSSLRVLSLTCASQGSFQSLSSLPAVVPPHLRLVELSFLKQAGQAVHPQWLLLQLRRWPRCGASGSPAVRRRCNVAASSVFLTDRAHRAEVSYRSCSDSSSLVGNAELRGTAGCGCDFGAVWATAAFLPAAMLSAAALLFPSRSIAIPRIHSGSCSSGSRFGLSRCRRSRFLWPSRSGSARRTR